MSILASGQLKVVPTTIFEVAGADVRSFTQVIVEKIEFYNTVAGIQTVGLSIVGFSEPALRMRQFKLSKDEGGEYLEPGEFLELNNGDAIEAESSSDDAVNFIIFGAIA